jgi:hypothetical protein
MILPLTPLLVNGYSGINVVVIDGDLGYNHCMQPQYIQKDKSVAVILAIFFGVFAWLYTYKLDAWKFWLNLVLLFVTFGIWGFGAWLWAVIDVSVKPQEYYTQFPL